MIRGQVTLRRDTSRLEARITIDIAGDDRIFRSVEAVIDTGFTGVNPAKPQFLTDTIFIPKRNRKRTKSTPHSKSTRTSKKKSASAPKSQRLKRDQNPALSQQERKEQGLCRCGQAAIQGQTRCDKCVEKHREWHRQYAEKRRRARGAQPRPRNDDTELLEQIRKEIAEREAQRASQPPKRVRGEAYNRQKREKQAQDRAERMSLGLCIQCGKPSPEGQTRCADCTLRHREYGRRERAKAKVLKEIQSCST